MKVLILFCVVATALASRRTCGVNQVYTKCGTACPQTCDNFGNPPKACPAVCIAGCHCEEGFVKTRDGRCVRPEECPARNRQVCDGNKVYKECGTACPQTCDNLGNPPKACPAVCIAGCHCEEGFVKTRGGRCVRPEECPASNRQVCDKNKVYKECGSACPLTCDNYGNPPKICPAMCVPGCHCENGYVKSRDGRCVRPADCPAKARPTVVPTCLEKPDKGRCLAYMPRWYYNAEEGKCYKFIYGGCQGNGNRYNTEEECLEHCGSIGKKQESTSACDLPSETGKCYGFFPRFYFDRTVGQCQKFIYGGCGGNENNFKTREECQQQCAGRGPTACQEEKVVGPCKAGFPRFFFNKETGKCEQFIYGGCNGNSNNFHSLEECEAVCSA